MADANNYNPDPDVEQLRAAMAYSRKHPEKFNYQDYLNEWQCKFAIYIDGLAKHVPDFQPTPKQKTKAGECLEAIRVGLVRCDTFEQARSAA